MARKTIYTCDRCKEEMEFTDKHSLTELFTHNPTIELCHKCYGEFQKFLAIVDPRPIDSKPTTIFGFPTRGIRFQPK
jgi:hypothetical protein